MYSCNLLGRLPIAARREAGVIVGTLAALILPAILVEYAALELSAIALLWLVFRLVAADAGMQMAPVFGVQSIQFLSLRILFWLLLGGVTTGLVGSLFSVGRFLRV